MSFSQRLLPTLRSKAIVSGGAQTAFSTLQRLVRNTAKCSFSSDNVSTSASSPLKEHIVVALGGNALLKRKEEMTIENQRQNIAKGVASLHNVLNDYKVTLVHGNGPQVGLLVLENDAYEKSHGLPATQLDVLDAETEGMIGYLLEQEIHAHLDSPKERGLVTILTQMVVDPKDPAFSNPTKFIGPVYHTLEEAQSTLKNLPFRQDGEFYRRVVPSPLPVRMLDRQFQALQCLVDANCLVICAGGGGIPVLGPDADGRYVGVEAVIDKDRAAAWVARALGAKGLLILTDVPAVALNYGTENARDIRTVDPGKLKTFQSHFPDGSMGPKVEAAIEFVTHTNGWAAIGSLNNVNDILTRKAGTWIQPHKDGDQNFIEFYDTR